MHVVQRIQGTGILQEITQRLAGTKYVTKRTPIILKAVTKEDINRIANL